MDLSATPPKPAAALAARARDLLGMWYALDLWPVAIVWRDGLEGPAGIAWLEERTIELDAHLLARHPRRIDEVLAHELAHLVIHARIGPDAEQHGPEWRALLEIAGVRATRFHAMDA
ncbi:MAG: SprT-like domain-containing protein [Planctomycetes bacterium]|nr:SprT-like domain-containing protein [Planctomycetota bacterium]